MNVNGVQGYSQLDAYSAYNKTTQNAETLENKAAEYGSDAAAVYEPSKEGVLAAKKYTPNVDLIESMKAEQEAVSKKLMDYVQESLMGQGNALGTADDVWKFLAKGNYTVTAAAKEEAQKAISDGGYFSVDKTAQRIVDFAKALTGGDPSQIEKMKKAVEKGFKEAAKVWGGDLPDISSKTHDAVMQKFDEWEKEGNLQPTI